MIDVKRMAVRRGVEEAPVPNGGYPTKLEAEEAIKKEIAGYGEGLKSGEDESGRFWVRTDEETVLYFWTV
jgi:hypothetical protein